MVQEANRDTQDIWLQIKGIPLTTVWHMDDLKVSHKDPFEITMFAINLTKFFGKNIMVKHDKVNDFLGIDWDYTKKGVVKVSMIKYISNIIKEFPETIIGSAPSPAADHLFQVWDEDDPKYWPLPKEQAIAFHHTIRERKKLV